MRLFEPFSLLFFVLFCACVNAEWADLDESGTSAVRGELEMLLTKIDGSKQDHHDVNNHVELNEIKWAQINDEAVKTTYTIRFSGTIGGLGYVCTAKIVETARRQNLNLECENLTYRIVVDKLNRKVL